MTKLVLFILFSMLCFVRPYFTDVSIISESILFYENSPATFICNDTYARWEIDFDYGTKITECNCPGDCESILFDQSRITAYCNESSPVLHFKEMKLDDNFKRLKCFGSSWDFILLVGMRTDYFYPEEPSALVGDNYTLICERDSYDHIYLYDDQNLIGTVTYNYVYNMDEENFDIIAEEWNITLIIKKVKLEDDGKIFGCYSQGNNLSLINLTVDVPTSNVTVTALNGKILYYENSPATFICDNSDAKWMLDDKILTECHCPGDCGNILFDQSRITAYCNESSPILHFKEMKLTDNFKRLKCFESLWDFTLLVGSRTDTFYPEEPFALAGSSYTLVCERELYQTGYLYDDEKTIGTIYYYYYYIENLDGENYDFSSDGVNITTTIKKVALEDDGKIFGCYLQGNGLSLLNLTVNVPVSSVDLYYIGVFIEDETVTFVCEVHDSKPQASFEWFMFENGSEREVTQNIEITSDQNGELWRTTSTLKLKLKRSFKAVTCRARILEMDWTNSRSLQLDIKVPVSSVTLQQTTGLLIEDENKIFVCKVDKSRPRAIVEWFLSDNGEEREIVRNIYTTSELNSDLFETTSILNLKLNRSFETIRCRARIYGTAWTNSNTLQLDIKYPPPGKPIITANEPNMCIGDQVTIICDWQGGYPNASLNFTCLSQTKANEDYVSITETLTRKMSKYCRCEGKHIARKEFTTYEISIQSRVSSVSLHQEKKNSFIEGKYGIFVCKVDESNSKAVFQWILLENGSEREITQNIDIASEQNGELWQTNSTLRLKLKRSFNSIKCRARIQEMCWTNSTSLLLDIKYPPPGKPIITVNKPQICVGEQILITCEWRGGHPSASLSLTCVSKTETKEDFAMITEPVTREMSNYCQCEGKHIAKNEFAAYNISIQYPPNKVKINQLNIKGNISSLICDASGGFPPVYNYSWSPGNYPPQKQINISLNDASIQKLTCTVGHKCKGDNPKSSTIKLFGEESNDIICIIVAPIIAAIIIIIAGSIICFKYRKYSMKKNTAGIIRPQSVKKNAAGSIHPQSVLEDATSENIYAHIDIQQNDELRRHIDANLEMQPKDEPRRHIDENLEMQPKDEPRRYEYLAMQPKDEPRRHIVANLEMQPKEETIYGDVENIEEDDNKYETPTKLTKKNMDSSIEFSETETH